MQYTILRLFSFIDQRPSIHLFEEKIAITNIFKQLAFCKAMHNSINTKIQIYSTVTWNNTLLS